jgi:predicted ATPase
VRDLRLRLTPINVLTGPNGCGKSNLYNAMFLLAKAAGGGFSRALAGEGGMPSVLYAGAEKKRLTRKAPPRRLKLGYTGETFAYELEGGLPPGGTPSETPSMFLLDPEIKLETLVLADSPRVQLMKRDGPSAWIRREDGVMDSFPMRLHKSESLLSQIAEPHRYPELSALGEEMRSWRFYHHFRTDPHSPVRQPQVGVMTTVLDHDGSDLAAALQTIVEIGDVAALEEAVARAFPGGRLEIACEQTRFRVRLHMPSVLRPLESTELSDGTLRYLCLVAALLSPRPPSLLALNEPETSLHPDLIDPLARLITDAARNSQLWITTHSRALADRVAEHSGEMAVQLRLVDGETVVAR